MSAQDFDTLHIKKVDDFEISGDGSDPSWDQTAWIRLAPRKKATADYQTRAKVLYSSLGLYFLFRSEDKVLTATMQHDFDHIYKEDVVEVFLWPDERHPIYFEYEVSPLNVELPIIIPNIDGKFLGWVPWDYEGSRKIKHMTAIQGGKQEPHADIDGWSAEFFIPFELLRPLANVPPHPGVTWRANLYRIDYDLEKPNQWTWRPVKTNFHDFRRFGYFLFE